MNERASRLHATKPSTPILTRRQFLAGATAGAAALALGACARQDSDTLARRAFGNTGHRSTRIIFGAYALSSATSQEDVDRTLALLEQYGVNHIDTAPSYGASHIWIGSWMKNRREDFFLATKTDQRTYDGAMRQIESSLRALQTDHVDLLQLHNLVDPTEWDTAMGPEGAVAAVLDAQSQGLTRHVGVTGHGVTAPAMHTKSLDRHDFDSVLVPWNYPMAQNQQYAADLSRLVDLCAERDVAFQVIKSIAHGGPAAGASRRYNTWYRPLETQGAIDLAVHWALGLEGAFVITSGDMDLLPMMLDAGSRFQTAPDGATMAEMATAESMQPLFT